MRHIQNYYVLLVAFLCFQSMKGQIPEPLKNIATPNVSNLGEYGDLPINMYTGQPNISIPLYEVVEDDIKIPISLRYDLSSVKPNRHPSWVGMGWNLSCGGQITRIVRGVMDEKQSMNGYASGYYGHRGKMGNIRNADDLKEHQKYFYADCSKDGYELMADEFVFNFCGYSGRFYLECNGQWMVDSDDDIKVYFNGDRDGFIYGNELRMKDRWNSRSNKTYCNRFFNKFTLITPDGMWYTFGGKDATEYSIPYYNQERSDLVPTTWYLTQISNTAGRKITLEYFAGDPICELKYEPWEIERDNLVLVDTYSRCTGKRALSGYLLFPVYLKKINTTFVTVYFQADKENRDYKQEPEFLALQHDSNSFSPYSGDLSRSSFDLFFANVDTENIKTKQQSIRNGINWMRLNKIQIVPNGDASLRAIHFYYTYTAYHKLLSYISEHQGVNDIDDGWRKRHSFSYDKAKTLPRPVYGSEDAWGYWNGHEVSITESATSLISKKSSSAAHSRAETLKSITYPTGGHDVFEYELNEYSKVVSSSLTSLIDENGVGGGLRVSKIITYDADGNVDKMKQYIYTKDLNLGSKSSGILKCKIVYDSYFSTGDQLQLYGMTIFGEKPTNVGNAWLRLRHAGGFISQPTNDDSPIVGYSSIFEKTIDAEGNNLGYIHYKYSNYDADIWGESHLDMNCTPKVGHNQ